MFNGIEISETRLLTSTMVTTCLLLLTIGIAIWAFLVLRKQPDKEDQEDRIKKLKNRAATDPWAGKKLKKLTRKYKKSRKEYIGTKILVFGLLLILISLNLFLAVIPGWTDYAKKDYIVYEGTFEVHRYLRNSFITLEDGTKLYGTLGLDDGIYAGTILYSRRTKFIVGKG